MVANFTWGLGQVTPSFSNRHIRSPAGLQGPHTPWSLGSYQLGPQAASCWSEWEQLTAGSSSAINQVMSLCKARLRATSCCPWGDPSSPFLLWVQAGAIPALRDGTRRTSESSFPLGGAGG